MNGRNISLGVTFLIILIAIAGIFYFINKSSGASLEAAISNPLMKRQVVQVSLAENSTKQPSVEASRLPQFIFSLADSKFDSLVNAASSQLGQLATARIVQTVYGQSIKANVTIDKNKKELIITPQDVPNFTPGLYKLSLSLRTIEGVVNINQDFTWGVIAVNTNKSIYKPGETAKIGIGVLDDKGNTLCKTGLFDRVDDLSMVVIDPQGNRTNFSIDDNTIKDSGKCGPQTVTNDADFQSTYTTTTPGIYEMTVTAVVYGKSRQIEDYFKVEPNVAFDVERTSFPTRIYPGAPYPMTFTVTANQNYQGAVTDIVPGFFGVIHVDGGHTEKDGAFTKIVWNANLTAGQPQTFSYFINFPMVSPEFYLIGPIQIGSFQEARQWQIASDAINSDSGVFTAEDNGSTNTWYRLWTGTAWNPLLSSPPNSIAKGVGPADSRWFREVSSPNTGEKLVGLEDNNNGAALAIYVYRWTGSSWGAGPDIDMTMTIGNASSQYMDIGFNQLSGNAMLVYCDNGQTQIHYDLYTASSHTWTNSGTFASTVPPAIGTSTTQKTWIRLIPQANSDNMLVGYLDSGNHVGAFIYDGDNNKILSGSELIDDATNSPTAASGHVFEPFSMAYETNDQVPMIMWGTGSATIVYRRFTGGSWSTESTTGLTGYTNNVSWLNAASDDTASSNNIAIATEITGNALNGANIAVNCQFAIWNGSSWTQDSTVSCENDNLGRSVNVAWEHNTGKALMVYVPSTSPFNAMSYRTWQGSFSGSSAIPGTETNQIRTVELYSDPNTVSIMCLFTSVTSGTNVGVFDTEWNGSSWTTLSSTSVFDNVGNSSDGTPEEAFGFGFDLNLEKQVAYRWFADSPGTTTSVNSALAGQDTPTTLTSANENFRLRMLLYYPDSLAIGGRSYALQYIDPGSGSCASPGGDGTPAGWTDVPNVNDVSNTIAYFDNASVASGSAATAASPGTLDPTFSGSTTVFETYNEQNTFTTTSATSGTNVGLFDFSLVDKTTFGRSATTFCFRVRRSTGVILKIGNYPQITTASLNDVQINGGSQINGGTTIQ
jgi:hypothetical protein